MNKKERYEGSMILGSLHLQGLHVRKLERLLSRFQATSGIRDRQVQQINSNECKIWPRMSRKTQE